MVTHNTPHYQPDRRVRRHLTDEDLEAVVRAVAKIAEHRPCQFAGTDPRAMEEAIKFYKSMNKILEDSKGVAGKTLIVLIVTGLFGILVSGIIAAILKKIQGGLP